MIPTRITQGGTNAAANFQEKLSEFFFILSDDVKVWIDELVIFLTDKRKPFHILQRFYIASVPVTSLINFLSQTFSSSMQNCLVESSMQMV